MFSANQQGTIAVYSCNDHEHKRWLVVLAHCSIAVNDLKSVAICVGRAISVMLDQLEVLQWAASVASILAHRYRAGRYCTRINYHY